LLHKRELPEVQRAVKIKEFLDLKDIMLLIYSLLKEKKRRVTHFALDLYIILLSAQRFQADASCIQEGVRALVESNRGRKPQEMHLSFPMIIGKTKTMT
jgi:hypothetical protein